MEKGLARDHTTSIPLSIRSSGLMNERKSFPSSVDRWLWSFGGTHEEFIYNEAPLWIPAPSTTSFIFKLCVNAVFRK